MITDVPAGGKMDLDLFSLTEAFRKGLPVSRAVDSSLEDAIRHVLDHPGSLIRLQLVTQLAEVFELASPHAINLAVGLEYFHSASLLFDDLPCMDNALERRGVPCAHLLYGDAGAILAALALVNRAYALTWRAVSGGSERKQATALEYLEQCLGVEGLLNGQSMDLNYSRMFDSPGATEKIARSKTVSLIRLTLVLPAMLGSASDRELQLLERIAEHWGLAYQVLDDLKDQLEGPRFIGKTTGRDVALGRPNAAAVLGIPAAIERVERLIRAGARALRLLCNSRCGASFLCALQQKLESELAHLAEASLETAGSESLA